MTAAQNLRVRELGGGVSNVVLAATGDGLDAVVKQSLPRLRVADEWWAKRERVLTEGAAIELTRELTPDEVPPLLDLDERSCVITIARAPGGWRTWKQHLLAGDADPAVAGRLGDVLATWHAATDRADLAPIFDDAVAFEQLRVDPYYRTVMRRTPQLTDAMEPYVERMLSTRRCLVHGDYSPKNVLVGDGRLWVIDFEVAHLGDPAFDVAFMLNHLVLKAIHRPGDAAAFARCAGTFWAAYHARVGDGWAGPARYVLGQLGCLLVARVDGKSPVEYLTEPERQTARDLGRRLLLDPPDRLGDVWRRLDRATR
ncbi:MAG: phosphotransferase [Actinobacteria bacterium]|nr:phosphotransferase [Actinomycetota bacterium]